MSAWNKPSTMGISMSPRADTGVRLIPLGSLAVELLSSRYAAARCDSEALVFSSGRGTVLDRHTLLSTQLSLRQRRWDSAM